MHVCPNCGYCRTCGRVHCLPHVPRVPFRPWPGPAFAAGPALARARREIGR